MDVNSECSFFCATSSSIEGLITDIKQRPGEDPFWISDLVELFWFRKCENAISFGTINVQY